MNRKTFVQVKRLCLTASFVPLLGVLSGCGNLTGLMNAHDNFGCPVSGGVNCTTLTQTYEREATKDKNMLELKVERKNVVAVPNGGGESHKDGLKSDDAKSTDEIVEMTTVRRYPVHGSQSTAEDRVQADKKLHVGVLNLKTRNFQTTTGRLDKARTQERVVMLWILPWVDDAGDLHEASRIWMRIEDAGWKIESVRSRAFEAGLSGVVP